MCGIFVAFNKNGLSEHDIKNNHLATHCTSHRGPDFTGFFNDDICFMGHNRLTILGLEEESNQPFEFDNHIIVYNGEIFNYIELKEKLIKHGYHFSTKSDTEVLLKAYIHWGEKAFNKFNGMWALCIYNKDTRELIISRDRFGQKPLFVGKRDDCFYFFSEPQQFHSIKKTIPDYDLIKRFIREGNYNRDDRRTFFDGVEEFPKAHNCILKYNDTTYTNCYWSYPDSTEKRDSSKSVGDFNELLKNAVNLRLRADVDIGLLI